MPRVERVHLPFLAAPVLVAVAIGLAAKMMRTPGFDALGYLAGAIVATALALAAPGLALVFPTRDRLSRRLVWTATVSGGVTLLLGTWGLVAFVRELDRVTIVNLPTLLFVGTGVGLGLLILRRGIRMLRAPLRHA